MHQGLLDAYERAVKGTDRTTIYGYTRDRSYEAIRTLVLGAVDGLLATWAALPAPPRNPPPYEIVRLRSTFNHARDARWKVQRLLIAFSFLALYRNNSKRDPSKQATERIGKRLMATKVYSMEPHAKYEKLYQWQRKFNPGYEARHREARRKSDASDAAKAKRITRESQKTPEQLADARRKARERYAVRQDRLRGSY